MTFPVYFHLLGRQIHPHPVMEAIGYFTGFQLYTFLRRRQNKEDALAGRRALPAEANLWILVGCIAGALVGGKLLAWVENAKLYWEHRHQLQAWIGPKTIVGGLLGGWIGIEFAKKRLGVTRPTGDVILFPLMLGMAIGRVGCFLTGLEDGTFGNHTKLPWAIDFGDGPRHPTQLYDIVFLALFALLLRFVIRPRARRAGFLWKSFILGYSIYRFTIEFIKPTWKPYLGLSAIQLACLATVVFLAVRWKLEIRMTNDETDACEAPGSSGDVP